MEQLQKFLRVSNHQIDRDFRLSFMTPEVWEVMGRTDDHTIVKRDISEIEITQGNWYIMYDNITNKTIYIFQEQEEQQAHYRFKTMIVSDNYDNYGRLITYRRYDVIHIGKFENVFDYL
jgi:hypothetical protein